MYDLYNQVHFRGKKIAKKMLENFCQFLSHGVPSAFCL